MSTSEFCRRQSERLLALARGCDDLALRQQLTKMAAEWLAQTKTEASVEQTRTNDARL